MAQLGLWSPKSGRWPLHPSAMAAKVKTAEERMSAVLKSR
jgi:hypothetical protein